MATENLNNTYSSWRGRLMRAVLLAVVACFAVAADGADGVTRQSVSSGDESSAVRQSDPLAMRQSASLAVQDSSCCRAEEATRRVITNLMMVGVGSADMLDTYLSPEKYSGTSVAFGSFTERRRPCSRWSRQIEYQADAAFGRNRADNATDMSAMMRFSYGAHRHWTWLADRLTVKAGALIDAYAGFLYNTRNGNNPAQARCGIDLTPSAEAQYAFEAWHRRSRVTLALAVPIAGVRFSPNYGQSYYEIFTQGNYDHNVVPTTFVSAPSLRTRLTVDVPLRHAAIRVGYWGEWRQASVNGLKSHHYIHSVGIGYVRRFSINRLHL